MLRKCLCLVVLALFCCCINLCAQPDTLTAYQKEEYKRYGEDFLKYLRAYNAVKYYTDKDLVKAKELLAPFYTISYTLLPKSPKFLGSYYNTKARIELQAGNQIAATNSFLLSIDYFNQSYTENRNRITADLSYEYIDLANVYYSLDLYEKAVPFYQRAASAFLSANDRLGYATSMNNLGLVYEKHGLLDSALYCFHVGLATRKKAKNIDTSFYYSHSLKYIARIKLKQKQYDSALQVLRSAELYSRATEYYGAKNTLVGIYNLYAQYYIERGQAAIGLDYFRRAIETGRKFYQNQMLCETYLAQAEHFFSMGDYLKAEKSAEMAFALAVQKSFFNERVQAVQLLCKVHTGSGEKKLALAYIAQYDSLNETRKKFIVASGLDALRESVKNRETVYSHVAENKLLQQENRTLLLVSLLAVLVLVSIASILYMKYSIKTRTEKALIKTKDELLRINAVKDRLFSILAHDLRSPFTALIGYSDMLSEDYEHIEKAEAKQLITGIHQVSKDTYVLLENLLDWSRIQSDHINCNPVMIKLQEELASTCNLLTETAKRKEINLKTDFTAADTVYADKDMLRTIVRNIISNAIKFSHTGTEIMVTSGRNGDYTEIFVKDSGIGMDAETINKLLTHNTFYTTRGTQQEKGTGLGLMLCKEFIEKNQGTLRIESTPGAGSTFIIAFQHSPWS